jgi:hypothetical protein
MSVNSKEAILLAAKKIAQSQGYHGLNFRDLAQDVGIKAASIYYHFPSKVLPLPNDIGRTVRSRSKRSNQKAHLQLTPCVDFLKSSEDRLRLKIVSA